MSSSQRGLVWLAMVALLALISWLALLPGYPEIYAPLNAMVLFPAFIMDEFVGSEKTALNIAYGFVPLLFCLWCWPLLRGRNAVPTRSKAFLGVAILASGAWLVLGFSYGVDHQGLRYVIGVAAVNVFCWLTLIGLAIIAAKRPSEGRTFSFHGAMFAWLAWCAFPYLGELP